MKRWIAVLLALLLAGSLLAQIPSALGFGDFDSDSDFGGSDFGSDYGYDDHDYGGGSRRKQKTVTPKPSPTPSPRPVHTPLPGGVDDTLALVLDWWEDGGDLNGTVSVPAVTDAPVTVTGQPLSVFYVKSKYYPYAEEDVAPGRISTHYTEEEKAEREARYSSSSSSRSSGGVAAVSVIFAVFVTVCIVIREKRVAGSRAKTESSRALDSDSLSPISRFAGQCPDADTAGLSPFIERLFRDMQAGWEAGSIANVRDRFVTDTWHRFDSQLSAKNARGETAHVRDIRLEDIRIRGWKKTQWGPAVVAEFDAYSNIWTTDREGRIISGSETRRLCQHFAWTLVWSGTAGKGEISCPNCGHTVDASSFAACPFCGSELNVKGGGWQLAHIDAISQKTLHR